MRYSFLLSFLLLHYASIGQQQEKKSAATKWEASVGSGLFLDLFYANIIFGGNDSSPTGYPNKPGNRVNTGKLDRIEIKYLLNKKSAVSFYFQNAQWRELFGIGNDPLSAWTETKRIFRRMHFTLNYYCMFPSGKRGTWSIGSGFQVQIEKRSYPYYRVDDPANPTVVTDVGARPNYVYFEDWAIPLSIAHHWAINKNLKLGILLNTAYTTGSGVDGLGLLGDIVIPFGKR